MNKNIHEYIDGNCKKMDFKIVNPNVKIRYDDR